MAVSEAFHHVCLNRTSSFVIDALAIHGDVVKLVIEEIAYHFAFVASCE